MPVQLAENIGLVYQPLGIVNVLVDVQKTIYSESN